LSEKFPWGFGDSWFDSFGARITATQEICAEPKRRVNGPGRMHSRQKKGNEFAAVTWSMLVNRQLACDLSDLLSA
jgi:hypothetical protein